MVCLFAIPSHASNEPPAAVNRSNTVRVYSTSLEVGFHTSSSLFITNNMAAEARAPEDRGSMTEDDWDIEAADMVEEVIKTQAEVATLLANHNTATSELQAMKESCQQELEVMQSDAWKLQMYSELERMRDQLELLAPLTPGCDGEGDNPAAAGSSGQPAAVHTPQAEGGGADAEAGNDRPGDGSGPGLFQKGEDDLSALDEEIAALDQQILEAKREMQSMMQMKHALKSELEEVGLLGGQAEAADSDQA